MTCNPCNPCENGCKECCNPNIQGEGCVTVDTSEEGVIKISAPCPTEVTSDDKTVTVIEKEPTSSKYGTRFDLSIPDNDRKVGACSSDTNPGALDEKLVAGHGVDLAVEDCPGDGKIVIAVDEDELNIPNNKVAVQAGCSGQFLIDAIDVQSDNIELAVSGCKIIIRDKKQYQSGKMVLMSSVTKGMEWRHNGQYLLSSLSGVSDSGQWVNIESNFALDNTVTNGMTQEFGGLIAHKTGLYLVSFNANFECSFGIHGMRVGLYLAHNSAYTPLLESRYSGPVGLTPAQAGLVTSGEDYATKFNGMYISTVTEKEGVAGSSASLGGVLDRMPNNGFTLVRMEEGDGLFVGARVQSSTDYEGDYITWNEGKSGKFTILGSDSAGNTGDDVGTTVCAYMLQAL